MKVTAYKLRKIVPPKDDLFAAIKESKLKLKEGDIVAISSKVVSIAEGRTLPIEGNDKEKLMRKEADWYFVADKSRYRRNFTIAKGLMVGAAGIDESNSSEHFTLYPKDPFKSARALRARLTKEYGLKKLAVIITDSSSLLMHRGAMGFALAWDGIDPLKDYRGKLDIFGRPFKVEMANVVDALAAAAVLTMGEGSEQTPVAVISGVTNVSFKNRSPRNEDQLIVEPKDDLFAPLIWRKGWKKGGQGK